MVTRKRRKGNSGAGILVFLVLCSALAAQPGRPESPSADSVSVDSSAIDTLCAQPDSLTRRHCLDSLAALAEARHGDSTSGSAAMDEVQRERTQAYVAHFIADASVDTHGSKEWAEALFVAAGVVVVGAVILYLPKLLYDYATDPDETQVYREAAVRYAYTGSSWDGGSGSPVYRDTHLLSARFTLGLRRPVLGMGLTVEGGYLRARLEEIASRPDQVFGLGGAFGLIGPSLRIGSDRYAFGVDFLNGTSLAQQIGWISEGRFSGEARLGKRFLLGAYLGALFYDLRFFDGLIWRRGVFNRDLALLAGVETGVVF